jgi:DNA-damage-inducible protein J
VKLKKKGGGDMHTATVNFRIDSELKEEAEDLFSDLGMSLETAFNVFLRQSVREQQIPFLVSRNVPNMAALAALAAAEMEEDMCGPFDFDDNLFT